MVELTALSSRIGRANALPQISVAP